MSIYEASITNPKKQLEFYKDLSEQLQQENEKLHSYKTLYQSLKKQKEELRDWLEEQIEFVSNIPTFTKEIKLSHKQQISIYRYILDKIEELEGVNDEEK